MAKTPRKRFCFVYRTTNLTNGKYYIGCHCTFKLDDGYLGSGMRILRAVLKYGRESFSLEILQFFETRELALAREKELVTEELLKDPMCMNIQLGGNGGWSREQCIKLSRRAIEKRRNDPEKNQAHLNRCSDRFKKLHSQGKIQIPNWTGRKHSQESIEKMKKAHANQSGNRNSQFGSCWIRKDGTSMKIKRVDLDQFLNDGWCLGRKM